MIKSVQHAVEVQTRRHASRRVGLAKAISRYLLKDHNKDYKNVRRLIISDAWKRVDSEAA